MGDFLTGEKQQMKFYLKLALALCLLSLFLSITGVYAQTSLTSVTSPTTTNLNSVCVVNNATSGTPTNDLSMLNAWAVGDGGTILFWSGSSWSTVTSPTTMNLYSVVFDSPTDGWAVGGSGTTGIILRYNGTWSEWTAVSFSGYANATDTVNGTLYGVTVSGDGMTGFAVGSNGIALYWDGASDTWFGFTNVSTNTLRAVGMAHDSTDAWAVGDSGTIVHWDGTNWTPMTSGSTSNLYTIQMFNSTAGFAAGGAGDNGSVLMLSGTTWSPFTSFRFGGGSGALTSSLNSTVYSMTLANTTSGWACGSSGFTMYWSGSEWDCNSNPATGNLKGISMVHGNGIQAWAVGDGGTILAFNGAAWVPELPILAIPILMGIGLLAVIFGKNRLFRKQVALK
jgi:hypothetical protein